MLASTDLFTSSYKNYAAALYKEIREETFGEDIGQTSWITADEYRQYFSLLKISPSTNVLEVAAGSGGPALFMTKETGCNLTGIDINENGVNNAQDLAADFGLTRKMRFLKLDASEPLPFSDNWFDIVISIDSINHLKDRDKVLKEFSRVLKKGGRLLFTDAVVVTGILSNEEIAVRSAPGYFLFVPEGENERLIKEAGFNNVQSKNITEAVATISLR